VARKTANTTATPASPARRTQAPATAPSAATPANHMSPQSVGRPAEDEIRRCAYQKWEAAGCPDGDGVHFWLEAEQELRAVMTRR
jgi:hypothetical protein